MTEELFSRLTDAQPAPLTAPAGVGRYTYTPRKTLRRVLDHALDHLNQIDQWLAWQHHGVVPTPTDGWVPSTVTLPDDRLPLAPADLAAWLWRIDQAARLLVQRAGGLTPDELDWLPPDGGWPLRRVLHHVARSEILYSASLDEALRSEDPQARYAEACGRLDEAGRDKLVTFPFCEVAVDGRAATATCNAASRALDGLSPSIWTFGLDRIGADWAITSVSMK
jgi:hypothetical protein